LEATPKTKALQEFSAAAAAVMNPAVESWKQRGGRVMGYVCSAVPDEIFTAAGLLPFRLRATGSEGTELSDSYFGSINCSFVRHCFNLALLGEYDFLDGLVVINSCDNVRRIYDHWAREMKTPFVRIMSFPRKAGPPQVDWYEEQLAELRTGIEEHFNLKISDDRLWEAIRLHNETRRPRGPASAAPTRWPSWWPARPCPRRGTTSGSASCSRSSATRKASRVIARA
jgi:benzoyl-CoA reductase/2-hydroxyglutaryl-CoA dehydratase subunit BcrC/BadD/HgdB